MSVPCTTLRRSSARVSASRSKPSSRDDSPMYIDGAYCACRPPMRSSARGIESDARSSSSWRASSARLSSRSLRTRSVTARRRARRRDRRTRRRARRRRRGSSGPRRSRAARRPLARRGRARAGRRPAPARPGSSSTRRPPRTRKRAASSAACGSRPVVDDVAHELEVGLRLHAAAHDAEGPRQAAVAQQQAGDDRVERAPARCDPVGVALLLGEARAAVVQRDPRVAHAPRPRRSPSKIDWIHDTALRSPSTAHR